MEQQNIPNRQDVYLTQAPNEERNKDLKDAYNLKAARILGVVHIMCGLIAFSSEINMIENPNHCFIGTGIWTGIWTSVFFFVSGGLAIRGAQSGSKFVVVSTMVMSIISAVCAVILMTMSIINWVKNRPWSYEDEYWHKNPVASYVLLILSGMAMLIAAILSASLTCKPLCCRHVKQELVHHHPNQHNNQAPYQPSQAHYHSSQVYYQPNQASYQPFQVNNLALYHPNQVPSQVNTTHIIPNSAQVGSLNLHVQPAIVDEVSPSNGYLPIQ